MIWRLPPVLHIRNQSQWLQSLLLTLCGFATVLAIAWVFLGRAVVEKLATALAMPVGIVWLALTILCVETFRQCRIASAPPDAARAPAAITPVGGGRRSRKTGEAESTRSTVPFVAATGSWCILFFAGNGIVADGLIRSLEDGYTSIDPLAAPACDVVVLLGGAGSEAPNGQLQVNSNGDRVVLTARLYHRGLAKEIICTGAKIEGLSVRKNDEAELSRQLLVGLGVPADAIRKMGGRNTFEEMQKIAEAMNPETRVGIITSAWHMPRAMRLAEQADINVVPRPANFLSGSDDRSAPVGDIIRRFIPSDGALSLTSRALREYLARLVGR